MTTESMDKQLVRRFGELTQAHPNTPVYTAPISLGFDLPNVMVGNVTHFMYSKGGKLWVGWFNRSPAVQLLFDAYGN